jgi:hypothetical protein
MNALPALSMIATDAVRRQFAFDVPPVPDRSPRRPVASRTRAALAALLERAAHAVAPAGYRAA